MTFLGMTDNKTICLTSEFLFYKIKFSKVKVIRVSKKL